MRRLSEWATLVIASWALIETWEDHGLIGVLLVLALAVTVFVVIYELIERMVKAK